MQRIVYPLVSVLCYFAFFIAFVYFAGFVGGFDLLPTHVDKGLSGPLWQATVIDVGLIALFGAQHSVMARKGFKQVWTKVVPPPLERSFYCLFSALALGVLYVFWHPLPGIVWEVTNPVGQAVLWALFALGFTVVFISTWLLSHFDLFGLAQMWRHVRGKPEPKPVMHTPLFYRWVRHPIYAGFFIALWSAPLMTVGHLLLAGGLTVYLLIGISYEEKDLLAMFGDEYRAYRAKVGMILPGIGRGS